MSLSEVSDFPDKIHLSQFDFAPAVTPPEGLDEADAVWMIVQANTVLRRSAASAEPIEGFPGEQILEGESRQFLGVLAGRPVWMVDVERDLPAPTDHRWVDLYSLYAEVGHDLWLLAGKAVQIAEWSRTHAICGRCGIPNERAAGERAMRCPTCRLLSSPRLSPAVIMAVHRDDEILLARGAQFQIPMFSVLAGFVEPGETLETAVKREVFEEVGVTVAEPQYFASQPWPFPNSLMLGFFAEYVSGDITPDHVEILEADWYRYDDLPRVPAEMSIAHRLIREFVKRRSQG